MLPCLKGARAFARNKDWKFIVVMPVTIADGTTIYKHGTIEDGSIAFLGTLKFFKEVSKLLKMILIDFLDLFVLGFVITVVRKFVMPFSNANAFVVST